MGRGAVGGRRRLEAGARRSERARLFRHLDRRLLALLPRRRDLLPVLPDPVGLSRFGGALGRVRRAAHHYRRDDRLCDFLGRVPAYGVAAESLSLPREPLYPVYRRL